MRAAIAVVFCVPLLLTGCTLSPTTTETSPDAGPAIQGMVRGGQSPIVGAKIFLFAAGMGGYGGASTSLLTSATGHQDTNPLSPTFNDYYVISGTAGAFSISGDYSCTANQQVYLYAVGGNPGLLPPTTNNAAAGLMAVLGNCTGGANAFLSSTPFVTMNEVTTVAAAYAFAGFATDATHVSSPNNGLALAGLQNAFANASNLARIDTGAALATPPTNALATAPQATVYTLANILASCVNTDGTTSTCNTLLNNAKSAGSTGTVPSDTATAAINIAHNPGANTGTLYGLAATNPPFGSALPSQPNDFTVGLELTSQDMSAPNAIAIDGSGNAWVANNSNSSLTELSSAGFVISGTNGWTGGGLFLPEGVAIDLQGHAWATNSLNNVSEFSTSGVAVTGSPFGGGGMNEPYGIAIDGAGSVWITNFSGNSVTELFNNGSFAALYNNSNSGLNLNVPRGIAIDGGGNVWIASRANNVVVELSNTGSVLSAGFSGGSINRPYSIAIDGEGNAWIPNYGTSTTTSTVTELSSALSPATGSPFTEGGAYLPQAVAIDGAGNAWIADNRNDSVTEFSSSGNLLSPSTGYLDGGNISAPVAIAVDGSGNIWVANSNSSTITELIGAGTPVVTPLAAGVKNNTLGTRP